jgi:hypothetical protein
MTCPRCSGLMQHDVLEEDGAPLPCWHCSLCGEWQDPVILHHRTLNTPPAPSRARTTAYDPEWWLSRWRARTDL